MTPAKSIAVSGTLALIALILGLPVFSASSLAATPSLAATAYTMDTQRSTLGFTGTQSGAPFEGKFGDFKANIVFSDDDLAHSSFDVVIATKSVDTGEDDRDETIRGADLFAVDRFPTARFVATSFTRKAPGQYEAAGKLTLRNVTRDIRLPFTFEARGNEARLQGGITLKRLDYGVGQGEWQDTGTVANEVKVKFALRLAPKAPAAAVPATADEKKQIPKPPSPSTSR